MRDVPQWGDLIGVPFRYGGRGPDAYDCYGLLAEMLRREGTRIPDYISPRDNAGIARLIGEHVPLWTPCELAPGAAIGIRIGRHVCHVAYAISETQMIHTWERTGGVTVERIAYWAPRIAGTYRFKP